MMDWFPAVIGLIGVLVGVGIQEFRRWREGKDKYGDMVFEKRLEAHQGAFYWCERLMKSMMPHRLTKTEGIEVVIKEFWEAQEWRIKNELYLDKGSREGLYGFLMYVGKKIAEYGNEEWRSNINVKEETEELLKNSAKVLARIEMGIGFKYLPRQEIPSESFEREKLLDEAVEGMEDIIRKQKG